MTNPVAQTMYSREINLFPRHMTPADIIKNGGSER